MQCASVQVCISSVNPFSGSISAPVPLLLLLLLPISGQLPWIPFHAPQITLIFSKNNPRQGLEFMCNILCVCVWGGVWPILFPSSCLYPKGGKVGQFLWWASDNITYFSVILQYLEYFCRKVVKGWTVTLRIWQDFLLLRLLLCLEKTHIILFCKNNNMFVFLS